MYMAPLWSQRPIPRGHEIYSLVEGFLVNIIHFSVRCAEVEIFEDFWKMSKGPLWSESHVIYNLCSSYPEDATYYIWKELAGKIKIINS